MRTSTCSLYIAADPARVWRAITEPAFTRRFYLGLAVDSQWTPGAPIVYRAAAGPVPDVLHGDIVHVEEGRLLVHNLYTGIGAEQEVHCWLTWLITPAEPGVCRVALTCDDVERDPDEERDEAWSRVLSGLKSVLEAERFTPGS
ncbi:SRPBCC domain-containing protein [Dactylosporangium sp. NBC_01737]|uniref:SRPBCC domain-containing protein n=1 Tax=Dactylosporangium sp. NBC_01737 TaxID=2975959 RepID=UPI002E11AFCF|nr:SRPBCC domain-containing protein [Dactylosporangium sp. NBC_01737]